MFSITITKERRDPVKTKYNFRDAIQMRHIQIIFFFFFNYHTILITLLFCPLRCFGCRSLTMILLLNIYIPIIKLINIVAQITSV